MTDGTHPVELKPDPPAPTAPPQPQPTPVTRVPLEAPNDSASPLPVANQLIEAGKLLQARAILNTRLVDDGSVRQPPRHDAAAIRSKLAQLNQILIFSSRVIPNDPLSKLYTIQGGDLLSRVAPPYRITYQLIERINGISARRIRAGQKIKVLNGPFHAVVDKSDFRMDVFLPGPDNTLVYVRSFKVGLGEDNSTPVGAWRVRSAGKVANPGWTNPRTGKVFAPDDPQNPIGEYWIGLEGQDDRTQGLIGYGIHGTIEPSSIGRQVSMGCVRMLPDDIALVYDLLVETHSTLVIQP